ncbi:MAG: sulfate adenylyltransferase subunit CysD [Planctomycetota bacterium]
MERYRLNNLKQLEAESIHIMREVVAEFENPVMLYSVGKDSSVMARIAQKAFHPAPIPFPFLHVDTGFKFPEMYEFRDNFCKEIGVELKVERNEEAIAKGTNPAGDGTVNCCGELKTGALLAALKNGGYDAAFGGARRDEEKSRAKERIYSFRDKYGQWEPKGQRPELWNLYNSRINQDESIRVFPLSNWTELDVWHYIHVEEIPVVPMYFAEERECIVRGEQLIPTGKFSSAGEGERVEKVMCRFRTLGCYPCTGAVRSEALTMPEIIEELMTEKHSERITRIIDHDQDSSMEQKKKEGYF